MGKVLVVNLSTGAFWDETIPDEVYEKYLSGMGLGIYMVNKYVPKGADPLGPDNMLGFVSGILTGTGALFSGRWMVVGKSPLTGGWGDANCGGNLSPAIKRCGYDGIFFTGKSEKPVYLYVGYGKVQLRDAAFLWGKDTVETEEALLDSLGHLKAKIACIGPAGEKLSLISGVSNDRGRMAARSGLGAVMGSKKLKAIALFGKAKISVHNKEAMKEHRKKTMFWVNAQPPFPPGPTNAVLGTALRWLPAQMAIDGLLYKIMLKKWGTVSMNQMSIEIGDSPVKNWKGTNADFGPVASYSVNPDVFIRREKKKYFCYSCPVGCGGICTLKNSKYEETHKPEYETVLALGGLLLNQDVESIFYLNEVLNRAGMDTISAGGTAAFAIECYEKGILTKADTGGLELGWGNPEAIVRLIEMMVKREGIGDILADGVKAASEKIGKGSARYAIHAGGQELPMHDGRNDPGFAVHYAAEPTPGRHTIGSQLYYDMFQLWHKIDGLPGLKLFFMKNDKYVADEEKAIKAAACSKFMNVINGAGMCMFGAFLGVHRIPVFEMLNSATGWEKSPESYMKIGERIQSAKQAFNIRHGIKPRANMANERSVGIPPLLTGANKGRILDIEKMVRDYWKQFGWDEESGNPLSETLKKLDIDSD